MALSSLLQPKLTLAKNDNIFKVDAQSSSHDGGAFRLVLVLFKTSIPKHYAFARYGHTPFIGSSTGLCIVAWEGTPSRTRKKWRGDMRSFTRVLPAKCHISGHAKRSRIPALITKAVNQADESARSAYCGSLKRSQQQRSDVKVQKAFSVLCCYLICRKYAIRHLLISKGMVCQQLTSGCSRHLQCSAFATSGRLPEALELSPHPRDLVHNDFNAKNSMSGET
eukprot:1183336-Prorocentrum_minimum.AAC.1